VGLTRFLKIRSDLPVGRHEGRILPLPLCGGQQLVGHPGHATTFVLLATPIYALLGPWLGRRFPKTFKHGYEPLFFDPGLSFAEKIARWRSQPMGRCNW
jgi:hypothetical protein